MSKLIGVESAQELREAAKASQFEKQVGEVLKNAFSKLMNSKKEDVKDAVKELICRIESSKDESAEIMGELVTRLNKDFEGDVGIFVVYFLNYITLQVKILLIFEI